MNSVFDLATLLFENRAVQIPDVGQIELDESLHSAQECTSGVTLIIDGVRHEFEGGPDAWSAVCAALVELTRPDQAARGSVPKPNGNDTEPS